MTVAVVEKIFLLLETLAGADHALSLKELAESTELPKPTAHRLLQTLLSLEYVVRDGKSSEYLLGHRIQELARGPIHQRVKDAAQPLMQKLHRTLGETVNLGVREALSVRYVDYLETDRPLRLIARPGQTDSLFTTALGRAMLSVLPENEVMRLWLGHRPETKGSLRFDTSQFRQAMATTRKRGWAEENGETVPGVSCLAVSLRNLGYLNAAVSIAVPTVRCDKACRGAIETIFREFLHVPGV